MKANELWPLHDITDHAKLEAMVATLLRGEDLPPVVACGAQAITGTHRIEAYNRARRIADGWDYDGPGLGNVEVLQVPVAIYCGVAECYGEHNDRCEVLYRICSDPDIRAALEDQRNC